MKWQTCLKIFLFRNVQLSFADTNLLLTCEVSGLSEVRRVAYNMRNLTDSVDFVNLVSWYLVGSWSGFAGFGNALNGSFEGCFSLVRISQQ